MIPQLDSSVGFLDWAPQLDSSIETYTEIPVLDLGPYMAGEKGALEEIGFKVRHIQETIGFWAVTNHGVSWNILENKRYNYIQKSIILYKSFVYC